MVDAVTEPLNKRTETWGRGASDLCKVLEEDLVASFRDVDFAADEEGGGRGGGRHFLRCRNPWILFALAGGQKFEEETRGYF